MSQLKGFSKYMKFSEIEVDQDFTENMKHLNARTEDPESYEWLLGKIKIQSSKVISTTAPIDGGATVDIKIKPSWELCYNEDHRAYEKRDINTVDAVVRMGDTTSIPATIQAGELYQFYSDGTIAPPDGYPVNLHDFTFMEKNTYLEASIPSINRTLYKQYAKQILEHEERTNAISGKSIIFDSDGITFDHHEDITNKYFTIQIWNNPENPYIQLLNETVLHGIPLTLYSQTETAKIYKDGNFVYNTMNVPDIGDVLIFVSGGENDHSPIPITEPIPWNVNSIFLLDSIQNFPLTAINYIVYPENVDTSQYTIVVPKTVRYFGVEGVVTVQNYQGILDISNASSSIQIVENAFENCESATLLVSSEQYEALQSRISNDMLDGLIPISIKTEVES